MAVAGELERSGGSSAARRVEIVEALGVEMGSDNALAQLGQFAHFGAGLVKNQDEQLREVIRGVGAESGPSVRQLVAMRRTDGQARGLYRLLTLPIRAALRTATYVSVDDGEEEREFIEQAFTLPPESGGMTVPFNRFMNQLLQGLFDGFSAFEKVYWIPEEGPLKGKIVLKKLAHRPSETVTFIVDKAGGFAGIRQRSAYYGQFIDVFIPRNRAFYWAAQEEEQKFLGVSYFESAFSHYDKKMRMYYAAHLAANRAAVGTRIGTVPLGASKAAKEEFSKALGNLSMAQWLMMPEGFKVEVLQEGGSYDFLSQINHHDSQMSKSLLGSFFDKDQGAGQSEGSLVSFGQPGDEMFNLMLRAIQQDIADQINHYIIPSLIDFNFKSGKYPKFAWGALTDEQNAAIAKTFDKIANQQSVTPEFIRALEEHQSREFGLDIDYDEIELREEEEAAAEGALGGVPGEEPAGGLGLAPTGAEIPAEGEDAAESPDAWTSLEDFEASMGIEEDPEAENTDFEDQLTLSAGAFENLAALSIDDFEDMLGEDSGVELSASDNEGNLLSMAQSLLDAAGGVINA